MEVSTALSTFNIQDIIDPQMTEADIKELRESEAIVKRLLLTDWREKKNGDDDADGMDVDEDGRKTAMMLLADVLGERYEGPTGYRLYRSR